MKKHIFTILLLFAAFTLVFSGCSKNAEKSDIYASVVPVHDFARKIAGDKQNISLIVTSDVHDYEPSAADMAKFSESSVIFYNGLGLDEFVTKIGENSKVKFVCTSVEIDVDEHDHEEHETHSDHDGHDHDHGDVNPHVWLYPPYAKLQMETIKNALCEFDPENAEYYKANYQTYAQKCDELDSRFNELRGKTIVVSHNAYGYWQSEYGINVVSADADGSDISPAKMKELVEFCKANNIKTIYYEFGGSDKTAKAIANEIGGEVKALNSFESNKDGKTDYFAVMEENLEALK